MYTFDNLPESIKHEFLNADVFEMIYGEPLQVITVLGTNGKQYTIVKCTKQPLIDLPRPESMEEFDREYHPALMSMLGKLNK
jgi:hypothetical protein